MFASIGPRLASPPTPDVRLSSSRFKRVTSMLFREISSSRLAISASYVSTVLVFSRDSSASAAEASVKSSTTDLRRSVSTRIRAISFCTFVVLVSSASMRRRISRVLSTTRRASFSVVLCSERLASIFSSKPRMSRSAAATDSSATREASANALSSFFARSSAASVSSCATTNRSYVSASFSFLSSVFVSAFCALAASVSVLRRSARSCSFFLDSSFACSFFAFVSASTKVISRVCSIKASRVALRASSRLAFPTRADFHCPVSCFFSAITASISAFASDNV